MAERDREREKATKIAMAVINAFRVGQITLVRRWGGRGVEVAGCTLYLIALCVLLLLRILTCCRRLMPAAHLLLLPLALFLASAYAAILCRVRAYVAYDYCRLNHTFSRPGEWLVIDKLQAPVAVLIMAPACGHQLMTANCPDQADTEEPLRVAIKCLGLSHVWQLHLAFCCCQSPSISFR